MEFSKLIERRRSIRAYAEPATKEDIEAILTMAQQAPSWKNCQSARCYAVTDKEKLAEVLEKGLPKFNADKCENASVIVTTFVRNQSGWADDGPANKAGNYWGAYDLGLHDAYLILAATDLGFDTLIMGIREADALREALDIPDSEEIMSVIAVGKRNQQPGLRPRKALSEVTKFF
ncbi:MAG: nitroreductase family protein [Firmicutes bacterium]|nr:nitroreductase family protein [Bacillota bacterium]